MKIAAFADLVRGVLRNERHRLLLLPGPVPLRSPHCVYSAYNVCPSADKAIINAVESNHTGWLKWCRENCSGEREFDYLDWALRNYDIITTK